MPMEQEPIVGAFYQDVDGQTFEVLAFDEDEGIIEIEYADGTVDEIDLETWYGMDLEEVEPEEDDEEGEDLDDDEELDDDVDVDDEDDYEEDESDR